MLEEHNSNGVKNTLCTKDVDAKIFQDAVHGSIEIPPLCCKIIDTPQFQRLRFITQLGTAKFVFPSATHTRFEHSIGVCHLGGLFVRTLQQNQPELEINEADILCIQIAGLCHDLGHGPYSHIWEYFIQKAEPELNWRHEHASVEMLDHLLKVNNLLPQWKKYLTERDLIFTKEIIAGPTSAGTDWPYLGRPKAKSFLYQIIANKATGIDVDKWDYFLRDAQNLGIKVTFDYCRLYKFSRVLKTEDNLQSICFRDKEVQNLYDMFHARKTLHRIAYQHRVTAILTTMIIDAFLAANEQYKFMSANGISCSLALTVKDMDAFTHLNDSLLTQIYASDSSYPGLQKAKHIIHRIFTRDVYPCIVTIGPTDENVNLKDVIDVILGELDDYLEGKPSDFDVVRVCFNYGMGRENPMEKVRFYTKSSTDVPYKIRREEVSDMLPNRFEEKIYRIVCRREKEFLKAAQDSFYSACEKVNAKYQFHDS